MACDAAGMILKVGIHVISPIAHTHAIACRQDLPKGFKFWEAYDRALIERCDGMIVLMADGWEQSIGMRAEIEIARSMRLPVLYLPWPDDPEARETIMRDGTLEWRVHDGWRIAVLSGGMG